MGYPAGVDIGTTYSAAAVARDGAATVFELGGTNPSMPSVAYLTDEAQLLVGEAAVRRASADPTRAAFQFKRRLGDPAPILLGGTPYSADALVAAMLVDITARLVEREEGSSPELVVITHPANFTEYKLDLLRQAARQAGVDRTAFLSEPQAAATHYAGEERIEPGESVLVYDFGGGTFDAAVLSRTDDGFELLGIPEGLERLGGIDIDDAVFGHVRAALGDVVDDLDPDDPAVVAALVRLRAECRTAKEALSEDVEASIGVMLPDAHTTIRLTRIELEDMIRPRVRDTLDASRRAIRSSGLDDDGIDRVLMVGGSSRIPLVREMVRETLGAPVSLDTHPKHSVALGAARHAASVVAAVGPSSGSDAPAPPPAPTLAAVAADEPAGEPADEPADVEPEPVIDAPEPVGEPAGRGVSPILWGVAIGLALIVGVGLVLALSSGDESGTDDAAVSTETEAVGSVEEAASDDPATTTSPSTSTVPDDQVPSTAASVAVPSGFVADDTGLFMVEIPDGWSDVGTAARPQPVGASAPQVEVAEDVEAFRSSITAPGAIIFFVRRDVALDQLDDVSLEAAFVDFEDRVQAIGNEAESLLEADGGSFTNFDERRLIPGTALRYAGARSVIEDRSGSTTWILIIGYFEELPDYEFTSAYQASTASTEAVADHADFLDSVTFLGS